MADAKHINIDLVRSVLAYDPDTGVLTWKPRDQSLFARPGDADLWNARYAGKEAGFINALGYRIIKIGSKAFKAHRLAWVIYYGVEPDIIDHISGVTFDNRISNLRSVSTSGNQRNKRKHSNNRSGVCGVTWDASKKRWQAHITDNDRYVNLGRFRLIADAIVARKAAEIRLGYHPNHGRAA